MLVEIQRAKDKLLTFVRRTAGGFGQYSQESEQPERSSVNNRHFMLEPSGIACYRPRFWCSNRFYFDDVDGSARRMGVKKTGKGRRKLGRKKRKMRSKIRHRK